MRNSEGICFSFFHSKAQLFVVSKLNISIQRNAPKQECFAPPAHVSFFVSFQILQENFTEGDLSGRRSDSSVRHLRNAVQILIS